MKPVHVFSVIPSLPAALEGLRRLAHNLRWAWDHGTIELFRRLDSDLWESTGHNPVLMLGLVDQAQLEAAARDESFLAQLDLTARDLDAYLAGESTWYRREHGHTDGLLVAYFSAEFGVTECLSVFAGGLGVLAGDHLKSASDLGVPLVGVGLLYQQGYFRQYLNAAGWQQESYEDNDFQNLPLVRERRPDGSPLTVEVSYAGRRVTAQIWRARVGRISLYLLDTNLPSNRPEDRVVTYQLYGGDLEMRLKQEILLGIGGFRALEALGLEPTVCHMNEGHSAFLGLEWVRRLMEQRGLSFHEAREAASAGLVFTTHTPVPAGHDYFPPSLMDHYFGEYMGRLGLSRSEFLALGRQDAANDGEQFCMTVLALRMASSSNGVSALHGKVSRRMWNGIWPGVPEDEVPIGHVTNGVHFRSWISLEMNQLYDRYLGPKWREEHADPKLWQRVESIPCEELWRTHERRRVRLVAFARQRLLMQLERRGAPQSQIDAANEVLDPDALTIGFARRFATYKRAALLLNDVERLGRILNDPDRPVQILFAGKAHPRDDAGKQLIQQIVRLAQRKEFRSRLVFLEDYDMGVARYLVQGVDIWLNTPLRPQEASGTSGMKALANGALNLSTLDGWWDEAWSDAARNRQFIGWAIGRGEHYDNAGYQDQVESAALYDLLEHDIAPTFYDRSAGGVPRRWTRHMKASIAHLCPQFNMQRVVKEYTADFYELAHLRSRQLMADGSARARGLAAWIARIRALWPQVRVERLESLPAAELTVGSRFRMRAWIHLGSIATDEVTVELYMGRIDSEGEITEGVAIPMQAAGQGRDAVWAFEAAAVPCLKSGRQGYTIRVLPYHRDQTKALLPGAITWADGHVKAAEAVFQPV
ncbi:MAG TPA: alpha-glucan family phosphorylase [Bryobacteraceae bacterium]|jgi:starch phosphorylase|nr:alpha-glucan family phosphorylase [Bryobacteraceae bacterium]